MGLWTSIIAGFLVSFLGGSRVQVGGAAGAFIPLVYAIVTDYGLSGLMAATMLSGVLLFVMGVTRMGQLIRFIPVAVVTGFTSGIAVVIFMTQIKDFLGLAITNLPPGFFSQVKTLFSSFSLIHGETLLLSLAALVFLLGYNRMAGMARFAVLRRVPGPLVMLTLTTLVTVFFDLPHHGVETIGSRFGGIAEGLPPMALPSFPPDVLGKLIAPSIAMALLCAIESLLSARVTDSMIDDKHDPDQELMAQGIANVVSPIFGGFVATGAIARSATNVRSGGRTPVAGIVHATVLLLIALAFAPLASHIPLCALSVIVMVVAVNMFEVEGFRKLRTFSNNYRIVMLSTFCMTVLFGITIAVEVGMVISCLLFIYRISGLTRLERVPLAKGSFALWNEEDQPRVAIWRLYGALFFGAAGKIETLLEPDAGKPDILMLDMQSLIQLDSSGLDALENLYSKLTQRGAALFITGLHGQPKETLERVGFLDTLGAAHLFPHLIAALHAAEKRLSGESSAPVAPTS
jgi:SulP family sulfate permease